MTKVTSFFSRELGMREMRGTRGHGDEKIPNGLNAPLSLTALLMPNDK
jgi:hypothetical protein